MITVLCFSVTRQTVYYENVNAISSLSPINLLLLLLITSKNLQYFRNTKI